MHLNAKNLPVNIGIAEAPEILLDNSVLVSMNKRIALTNFSDFCIFINSQITVFVENNIWRTLEYQ